MSETFQYPWQREAAEMKARIEKLEIEKEATAACLAVAIDPRFGLAILQHDFTLERNEQGKIEAVPKVGGAKQALSDAVGKVKIAHPQLSLSGRADDDDRDVPEHQRRWRQEDKAREKIGGAFAGRPERQPLDEEALKALTPEEKIGTLFAEDPERAALREKILKERRERQGA
jgi:hypothetical protein